MVAITALGGIAYLADFSIGASIGLAYGTTNAIFAILLAAIVIFLTGITVSYYAARYNIDLDLISRGAGFGYYGTVITSVIFASFTFIFFALEGAIMAQGLKMGLGVPLWIGYLISSVMVIPLVIFGMKALSTLQVWTTPLWLFLMVGPVAYLVFQNIIPGGLAIDLAVVLVVISQIKINVTNAYSGSLSWTSAYARVTKHYPGRIIFIIFNVSIALLLMEMDMFSALGKILGFYSNFAIAWIVIVSTDIAINKYVLGLSPIEPEFRRGMLYDFNPVGLVSFGVAAGLSNMAFFGLLGDFLAPYSPIIALVLSFILTPIMAIITQGKYYLKEDHDGIEEGRFDLEGTPVATLYDCLECDQEYERPDVLYSLKHNGIVCSLCKTLEKKV